MAEISAKQIGIVLFPDVEELDAIGPWEVLSYWTRTYPQDGYAVSCLSRSGGLVHCAKGLVVQAHHSAPSSTTTRISTGCETSAPPSRS